jgi:cyanate permease
MSGRLIALLFITAAFGVLTTLALLDVGYLGILAPHFQSWGGAQVLTDLVIVCILVCIWMGTDARERGLPVWPFIAITLVAGSFGPLSYLIVRELRAPATGTARSAA